MSFNSAKINKFLKEHPKVILISMPRQPSLSFMNAKGQMEKVVFPVRKHNYLLTFPDNAFSIVSFEWPKFLVPESVITRNIK